MVKNTTKETTMSTIDIASILCDLEHDDVLAIRADLTLLSPSAPAISRSTDDATYVTITSHEIVLTAAQAIEHIDQRYPHA
jgi:hypothetical protein